MLDNAAQGIASADARSPSRAGKREAGRETWPTRPPAGLPESPSWLRQLARRLSQRRAPSGQDTIATARLHALRPPADCSYFGGVRRPLTRWATRPPG